MSILSEAKTKFLWGCTQWRIDLGEQISIKPLLPDDAIGKDADENFAIKKGKERVIEATFLNARGQAFTDQPTSWTGTLADLLLLNLDRTADRALFVAGLNAVLRHADYAHGTIHCKNEEPKHCGIDIAAQLAEKHADGHIALIGLQPAILAALVQQFGAENVRVADLNPDNIGTRKSGVAVEDGETALPRIAEWCGAGLATGSSVVNGTIDDICEQFELCGKSLYFFGNTISGVAALLRLNRICPYGR